MEKTWPNSHGSKLDQEKFEEFSRDWTLLSYQTQEIRVRMQDRDGGDILDLGAEINNIPAREHHDYMMRR